MNQGTQLGPCSTPSPAVPAPARRSPLTALSSFCPTTCFTPSLALLLCPGKATSAHPRWADLNGPSTGAFVIMIFDDDNSKDSEKQLQWLEYFPCVVPDVLAICFSYQCCKKAELTALLYRPGS